MEPTIKCGVQLALHAKLTGSRFEDVCLGQAEFENVNLAGAHFHDINFSDVSFSAALMGGCTFRHIGFPPGSDEKQRPMSFIEADLNSSTFVNCDLSKVRIEGCELADMTIDGIPVADLLAAYNTRRNCK